MIFISGNQPGPEDPGLCKTVISDRCGRYGRFQVVMTYMYFSFSSFRCSNGTRKYYVKCPAAAPSTSWTRRLERFWPGADRWTLNKRT